MKNKKNKKKIKKDFQSTRNFELATVTKQGHNLHAYTSDYTTLESGKKNKIEQAFA